MPFAKYFFCLLFICNISFSQSTGITDYKETDSIARSITYKKDLRLLVSDLTKNHESKLHKARAIFIWIADNIAYDYKQYNKHKRDNFKCKKGKDCKRLYVEWENKLIEKTLSKKMAVCEGYARLFKRMCEYAGISADVVSGYTKNDKSQIGRMGTLDHAWNGITIDGEYYYLDVTWAAGGCSKDKKGKLTGFHKNYNDYYWLTPADNFFRDHFPKDKELPYVMVDSKQKYMDTPYINQGFIHDIEVISPEAGILTVCVGDTIHFAVAHKNMLWSSVQVNSNIDPAPNLSTDNIEQWNKNREKHKSVKHAIEDYIYSFEYVVTHKKLRHIDVYFDHNHLLRFRVKMMDNL